MFVVLLGDVQWKNRNGDRQDVVRNGEVKFEILGYSFDFFLFCIEPDASANGGWNGDERLNVLNTVLDVVDTGLGAFWICF